MLTQASTLFAMRPRLQGTAAISRGVYVLRTFLCKDLPYVSDTHIRHVSPRPESQTERQQLEMETTSSTCRACHDQISPIGFTFERYDALGVWRDRIQRKPDR